MNNKGLYLYCLAEGNREGLLELQGVQGTPIQALAESGFTAVIQECEPKPFASEDQKVMAEWLLIHQNIVDVAWEKYETVIPFGFDTIIVPTEGKSARENLAEWLKKESGELKNKLNRLKQKAEFGIQVLWNPAIILPRIKEQDPEMQNLEKEIQSKPEGTAYLLRKKLEELMHMRLENAADAYFKVFYKQIRECVEDVRIEKTRKEEPPRQMILNLSCLQKKGETAVLGAVLERIGQIPGFDVRFTGPWPPYSFVNG
ncbi:MAG: GvpL/GvpF family gas vesicle protein [Deltaproteobacteria bacterium]|nr:GvpL/GvpF family gas vesicle protein [Deltaproteobacteria bacterium]